MTIYYFNGIFPNFLVFVKWRTQVKGGWLVRNVSPLEPLSSRNPQVDHWHLTESSNSSGIGVRSQRTDSPCSSRCQSKATSSRNDASLVQRSFMMCRIFTYITSLILDFNAPSHLPSACFFFIDDKYFFIDFFLWEPVFRLNLWLVEPWQCSTFV